MFSINLCDVQSEECVRSFSLASPNTPIKGRGNCNTYEYVSSGVDQVVSHVPILLDLLVLL